MSKKYCIWCGSEINEGIKHCTKCGKAPSPAENLLQDWLIKHTKDYLKNKSESSLVSAIKNWAISNLYGLILSITVVTVAASALTGSNPEKHIQQVDTPPQAVTEMFLETEENGEYEEDGEFPFTIDEIDRFDNFIYDYEQYILENRDNLTDWPEEFWLIPAMSGNAEHQLHHAVRNNLYYPKEHLHDMFTYPLSYSDQPVSDIGRSLKDQGFRIAVTERCLYMYISDEYSDMYSPDEWETAGKAYYTLTLVEINDKWHIAEEFVSLEF